MMPPDALEKLRKIAGMMTSSHDGEKLAAVNRANALLASHKATWAEVIGPTLPRNDWRTPYHPPPPPQSAVDMKICPDEEMEDDLLRAYGAIFVAENNAGKYDLGGVEFMESVIEQTRWSEKQRAGLIRSMRRAWMIRRGAGI